ncbi:MAG TPA: CocE/NonD family hydrolase [Holophagaceae bacterium]|nr:CocE/NonD family hydrolase [Holophagaceae bacterium]
MRRLTLLLAASTLLPAQGLEAVKAKYEKREVLVPMRDGVKLFTAIYVPKDASPDHPYPVVMQRTPYSVAPYGPDQFKSDLGPSPLFGTEGFIFVYQDVRGRLMSEGTFVNMTPHRDVKRGPQDTDESSDTFDTVEWVVKHLPTNGRVGQWGISYPGFYTAAGMIDAHPAMKAVSPQAPIVDWFTGDDFHRNGALWLPHAFNFMVNFGRPRPEPTQDWGKPFEHGMADGYAYFLRLGSLAHTREVAKNIPFWLEMMDHPNYDAFWQMRNLRPHLKAIKPAVLTVGGLFDAENLYGALQVYQAANGNSPQGDVKLVMGPWFHGGWARGEGEFLGKAHFGSKTSLHYREQVEFPFFMHHLKGAPDPKLPEATMFNTGANQWRSFDAWPPKTEARKLYFLPGGRLAFDAPKAGARVTFPSDPAKPVPFVENVAIGMTREYMTDDQRFAATRPDVLVFQTEPLAEDLTFAGPLLPELRVATTGQDADWVVKLIDVHPDDYRDPREPVAEGERGGPSYPKSGGYQMLVRGEVMRGRFRNSYSHPEPFKPGQATRVAYRMNDVLHTFKKGHRIMIQVQSSWFPLMDRNPQTWVPNINEAKDTDFKAQTHTLFLGGRKASCIAVRVLN